ncbi:MAG: AlbA family DNA-binding domain-containing protein [Nitrospiraceae bacterium]
MDKASLFVTDLDKLTIEQVKDFCGMKTLPDTRVKEGLRIDYKREFPSDLGKSIASMANTSGGLVLIGIEEDQGVPITIEGIDLGADDIKTRISNIAYSTIDEPLIPEVGVCFLGAGTSRGVVVVRVPMSQNTPHMYMKGGDNTIYVRINDRLARADRQTIDRLYQRKAQASEGFRATLSRERDFVGLTNYQNGFRALTIVPELLSECRIHFNQTTDLYFEQTKPMEIWGDLIRDRNHIAFVGQKQDAEQRFSIGEGGIIHYGEAIENSELAYVGGTHQGAILFYRIEFVLKMILPYAKEVFNHFGYFGDVHTIYRLGRIQDKFLSNEHGLPLSPRGANMPARQNEISIERRLSLDDIGQRLDVVITSILEELCRGAFGFNLEAQWR